MERLPIDPDTRIGHVHLKVSDLDQSIWFYTELLGFRVSQRLGDQAVFLSAGGYHHHIGLNTWESAGGPSSPNFAAGLYHFAVLLPNRIELARSLQRLLENRWPVDGASDHGVSESIYLRDPDGIGIELYADRPQNRWPSQNGQLDMYTKPLDMRRLLADLHAAESRGRA
jgi:catechol 2,3-dioxygenase